MKKKLLVWLLVVVLALGALSLVACKKDNLEPAVLEELLKLVKDNNSGIASKKETFTVAGSATTFLDSGESATCDIKWTISGTDKVTVSKKDSAGKYTILFPGTISENISFTLKATLVNSKGKAYKSADGTAYEATWTYNLTPGGASSSNHYDYKLEPVTNPTTGTPYKLALIQNNVGKYMFIDPSQGSTDYYIGLLYDNSKNVVVPEDTVNAYLEDATGGYYLKIQTSTGGNLYVNCVLGTNNYVNTKLQSTASTVYTVDTTNHCLRATVNGTEYYLGNYSRLDDVRTSKTSYLGGEGNFALYLYTVEEGSVDLIPKYGADTLPALGTAVASLDMTKTANRTVFTASQVVFTANGITFTNDKGSSSTNTNNYNQENTKPYRIYSKSTITIAYTGMKAIKITMDYYPEYQGGFDGMTVDGATFACNENILVISFASPVNTFTSAPLSGQTRIRMIEVFTA